MPVLRYLEDRARLRIFPRNLPSRHGKYGAWQRLFMSEKKRRWSRLISDALLMQAKRVKKHEETWG